MTQSTILLQALANNKPIAILGNTNTGKTNLTVYFGKECPHPNKYLLGYPIKIDGFKSLNSLQDLNMITNAVVLVDELDDIIPITERKSNDALKRVLKYAEHNKIKIIFNTQLSQFVNKMMEAFIPCWAITQIDIFSLKNGSKPKRILLDYIKRPEIINKEVGMRLPTGQFVWFNDNAQAEENGIYEFPFMEIGKDKGNKIFREQTQYPAQKLH